MWHSLWEHRGAWLDLSLMALVVVGWLYCNGSYSAPEVDEEDDDDARF